MNKVDVKKHKDEIVELFGDKDQDQEKFLLKCVDMIDKIQKGEITNKDGEELNQFLRETTKYLKDDIHSKILSAVQNSKNPDIKILSEGLTKDDVGIMLHYANANNSDRDYYTIKLGDEEINHNDKYLIGLTKLISKMDVREGDIVRANTCRELLEKVLKTQESFAGKYININEKGEIGTKDMAATYENTPREEFAKEMKIELPNGVTFTIKPEEKEEVGADHLYDIEKDEGRG